jgi:predicted nucleic acid-binding protein
MTIVVDTSALLALLYPDVEHDDRAAQLLTTAAEDGRLAINSVVYSELATDPTFGDPDELEYFLDDTGIAVDDLAGDVAYRAGEAFQTYLERRGEALECPDCGHETTFECPDCDRPITARQHIAADFLIGAHAESVGTLLSFDAGFYRDYFDVSVRTVTG